MYCWLWRTNDLQIKHSQGGRGGCSICGMGILCWCRNERQDWVLDVWFKQSSFIKINVLWNSALTTNRTCSWERRVKKTAVYTKHIRYRDCKVKWKVRGIIWMPALPLSRTVFLLFDIVTFKIQKNGTIQKDKSHKIFLTLCFLFLTLCSMLFDLVWFVTICGMTGV